MTRKLTGFFPGMIVARTDLNRVTGFLANDLDEMAYYATKLAYEEDLRVFIIEAARKRLHELADDNVIWGNWKRVFEYMDGKFGTRILTNN